MLNEAGKQRNIKQMSGGIKILQNAMQESQDICLLFLFFFILD
jgi:hypothetical protein